jgi:hypothetical protein
LVWKAFHLLLLNDKIIFFQFPRTTPLMAALIVVYVSLIVHFGSGPLWDTAIQEELTTHCKQNWWTAVLHIQNYVVPFKEMVRNGFEWR